MKTARQGYPCGRLPVSPLRRYTGTSQRIRAASSSEYGWSSRIRWHWLARHVLVFM
jgi:hypothetical protein